MSAGMLSGDVGDVGDVGAAGEVGVQVTGAHPTFEEYGSFDDLFRAHYGRLVGAMRLAGADPYQSEDLAQEAMARTLAKWRRVRRGTNPAGYAYTTAFRLLRKRVGVPTTPTDDEPLARLAAPTAGPEGLVACRDAVARAIAAMPPQRRACAAAVLHLGLSADEAGQALGIQASTVRAQVSRARADLHAALGE